MKIELTVKKEFEIEFLQVSAGVRYWEDATVNDTEDENGLLIPCRDGDRWKPIIEIETGKIVNWEQGTKADIHYKVCDDGLYTLIDEKGNEVKSIDGYVPSLMSPKENGYGDYIIMDVDENGIIQNWVSDLSDFDNEDED